MLDVTVQVVYVEQVCYLEDGLDQCLCFRPYHQYLVFVVPRIDKFQLIKNKQLTYLFARDILLAFIWNKCRCNVCRILFVRSSILSAVFATIIDII